MDGRTREQAVARFAGIVRATLFALAVVTATWACAAIWIDGPAGRWLAGLAAFVYALLAAAVLLRVRPLHRTLGLYALLFLGVLIWWLSLEPRQDRAWNPSVARPAEVRIDGDTLHIRNVRNFDYRSENDFDERWEERSYDLSTLRGADLFLSQWGPKWIAHTIVSWDFGDDHLAISIETRPERHEFYSALRGFFRQYELYYVVADERDLVGLRTNHRSEEVYLYPLRTPVDRARALLLDYVDEINRLAEQPRWYNALTHNCTTAISKHLDHVTSGRPFDWRILANGFLPDLMYERGTIDTSRPLAQVRRAAYVVDRAQAAGDAPDFSARIRE